MQPSVIHHIVLKMPARLKMPYKLFVTKETGGRPYLSFEDISYASKNLQ